MQQRIGELTGQLNAMARNQDRMLDLLERTHEATVSHGITLKEIRKDQEELGCNITQLMKRMNEAEDRLIVHERKINDLEGNLKEHIENDGMHTNIKTAVGGWTMQAFRTAISAAAGAAGVALWEFFRQR